MKYKIHYWSGDLSTKTGYHQNDEINDEQLLELIHEGEVNVMIFHTEVDVICFIHNGRFGQS